jgi:hypothetical protein
MLAGSAPFGYDNFSPEYLQKIKMGLTQEHLEKIACPVTRELVQRLMENDI